MKDRTARLLRKLVSAELPISMKTLSEEFQLSARTMRNEINELNAYLSQQGFPQVYSLRGKGLKLQLNKKEKETVLATLASDKKNEFLNREERILDLILDIGLAKKKIFLFRKEEEYQVSKSTVDEDMRRLRELLKGYGVNVLSVPKEGLILEGKEKSIRTMLYSIINKAIGTVSLTDQYKNQSLKQKIIFRYIPITMISEIDCIYDSCISASEDNYYRKNLVTFTSICIVRFLNQKKIENTIWLKNNVYTSKSIEIFVETVFYHFSIQDALNEFNYLTFILETLNQQDMSTSIDWVQAQLLSIQLIQHVENQTHIPFSKKEEVLQEGLYQHIAGLLNRVRYDVQFANPLKKNIQKNYDVIYRAVNSFAPVINQLTGKEISQDELAFLVIHFSTSLSELNQEVTYYYRAVVICNHGTATGKLLSENLKELFNIEVLAVLSSREIGLIEKLDADLVFSTVPIEEMNKPLLVLEPIIKEDSKALIHNFLQQNKEYRRISSNYQDMTHIFHSLLQVIDSQVGNVTRDAYEELAEIFKENQFSVNKRELQPMIQDILEDEHIILQTEAKDWQELIKIVADPLVQDATITQQYVQAMIDSVNEFGPYIVIGKHLALAHARPEDGANQLGLSVATVKEPVRFGHDENDPVKIIFCLSAVDSFSHLNIMKYLVQLINDEEKTEQLDEATTVEDFKKILFND
ncbi:BglG family transcription antiterminator [Tetragenococcus koreensis]|uniref:BglG family transcription antiterminator n=1 Tax=Tetragenococcus koreensis TaxID=290335 RepID=UPI001F2FCC74|nr:PTS sugar transporter subunit IIA [Tetragenococcus koreensis]MCF1617300.1 PTS sugar transporter subunit IIA [Tetragenococcus koreensis]MCF1622985.1 PTS sugar transporter subunit IIA [Tetragenococcus koreensis]MCF1678123.1 PTS sugar transporter subunit IIA [Tetragenococcus koreensis]MCF1680648.1 PTS sugar transporter subunit IIA [Tetragenococcus koreensis]MCF1682909.1 PTS sugar transporter subunit IIA [Tetragenococcus koreensis]